MGEGETFADTFKSGALGSYGDRSSHDYLVGWEKFFVGGVSDKGWESCAPWMKAPVVLTKLLWS